MKARVISNVKERNVDFELGGKTYPVSLTLNCIELLQEKYGSLEAAFDSSSSVKELKFIFKVLLDEAVEIFNETASEDEKLEKVTESFIGRKINVGNLDYYISLLADVFEISLPEDDDYDPQAEKELKAALDEAVPDMPDSPNTKAE